MQITLGVQWQKGKVICLIIVQCITLCVIVQLCCCCILPKTNLNNLFTFFFSVISFFCECLVGALYETMTTRSALDKLRLLLPDLFKRLLAGLF